MRENVFKLCKGNRWKYLFRFKEGSIKSIAEEFKALKELDDGVEKKTLKRTDLTWVNDIAYRDFHLNILACQLETDKENKSFTFITVIMITEKNAQKLVNAGRSRWKIENEGFNRQKNLRYHIQHASSHDYNALKNHYLLT